MLITFFRKAQVGCQSAVIGKARIFITLHVSVENESLTLITRSVQRFSVGFQQVINKITGRIRGYIHKLYTFAHKLLTHRSLQRRFHLPPNGRRSELQAPKYMIDK
ncbi:hypothetical protein ES703_28188 [subsurface metagenome]